MSDYKTLMNNTLMINRFIDVFGIDPNSKKNKKIIAELTTWGEINTCV